MLRRKYFFYLGAIINLLIYYGINLMLQKKIEAISKNYCSLELRHDDNFSIENNGYILQSKTENIEKDSSIVNSDITKNSPAINTFKKEIKSYPKKKAASNKEKNESVPNLTDNLEVPKNKNDEEIIRKSKIKNNFLFSESEKKYYVPVEVAKENIYDIFEAIEIFRNDTDEDIFIGKIVSQNPPEKLFEIDFPFPKGKMVRSGSKAIFRITTLPIDYNKYGKIIQTITISTSYVNGEKGENLQFVIVK